MELLINHSTSEPSIECLGLIPLRKMHDDFTQDIHNLFILIILIFVYYCAI